jgi:hypothetical protein
MTTLTDAFEARLHAARGPVTLGQLRLSPGYFLGHCDDLLPLATSGALVLLRTRADLREWIKTDATGAFRPVRGLKNLRPGWRMGPLSIAELVDLLHLIYPGCVADWVWQQRGKLPVTEFAETATRQTGMYRITQLLQPTQLDELTRDVCDTVCVRRRLWQPVREAQTTGKALPVLCPEACNFLVGKAREKIKGKPASGE